jgi:hypothetical protein
MNTAIDYMYRDASNYKLHDRRVFPGEITAAERDAIIAHLDGYRNVDVDSYLDGYQEGTVDRGELDSTRAVLTAGATMKLAADVTADDQWWDGDHQNWQDGATAARTFDLWWPVITRAKP